MDSYVKTIQEKTYLGWEERQKEKNDGNKLQCLNHLVRVTSMKKEESWSIFYTIHQDKVQTDQKCKKVMWGCMLQEKQG